LNWDQVKGNGQQFTRKLKERRGKLTNDGLTTSAGRRDQPAGKLQGRSGYGKDQAQLELEKLPER
jgi:uncharacterized protein YjbJ (UPF0337 family)